MDFRYFQHKFFFFSVFSLAFSHLTSKTECKQKNIDYLITFLSNTMCFCVGVYPA